MKTLVAVLAVCIISAHASLFEDEHRQQLRLIRGICIAQSGLNPYEIGNIIKAIRPTTKLLNASRCVVRSLIELRETNEVANDIVNRGKFSITNNLPKIIDDVIASCDRSLGPASCDKVFQLLSIIIEERQRRRNPLLQEV